MNFKGKDCIIYLVQRLAGMDKCVDKYTVHAQFPQVSECLEISVKHALLH